MAIIYFYFEELINRYLEREFILTKLIKIKDEMM